MSGIETVECKVIDRDHKAQKSGEEQKEKKERKKQKKQNEGYIHLKVSALDSWVMKEAWHRIRLMCRQKDFYQTLILLKSLLNAKFKQLDQVESNKTETLQKNHKNMSQQGQPI